MHIIPKLNSLIAIILSVMIVISATPFFLVGNPYVIPIILTGTILFFLLLIPYIQLYGMVIKKDSKAILIFSFILFLYIAIPFRAEDRFLGSNVWFIIFMSVFLLKDEVVLLTVKYFSNIIFGVALMALIVYFSLLIGINLPLFEYHTGVSDPRKALFLVYPGTAYLNFQDYTLFGRTLFRLSGIFSEPGHYGIISALVLFFNENTIGKKRRVVILISGILTLSMGFYVLLIAFLLLNFKANSKYFMSLIFIFATAIIIYFFLPENLLNRFFLNKLGPNSDVLDSRTSHTFSQLFSEKLVTSIGVWGGGADFLSQYFIESSDIRGFILKYGLIGVILYCCLFLAIQAKMTLRGFLLTLGFVAVVFIHRSWMVGYLIFLFAMYTIPLSHKYHFDQTRAT